MTTIPVSEARATLPALIDQVRQGAEVVLTRHGEPVAILTLPPGEDRTAPSVDLSTPAGRLNAWVSRRLDEAKANPQPITPANVPPGWSQRLIAEMRADQDSE